MGIDDYGPKTFGERYAPIYDDLVADGDAAKAADLLQAYAQGGNVLELGIGTGRIALLLLKLGIVTEGIDASPEMVAELASKPGGSGIRVHLGNFAELEIDGSYSLIFCALNTFCNLTSQEEQVRCFINACSHLDPGGRFVVETEVPDLSIFNNGSNAVRAEGVESGKVVLEVSSIDPVAQRIDANHVHLTEEGIQILPLVTRYTWPSELDLMAQIAGMRCEDRFSSWTREAFTGASTRHIGVYVKG